jgi:NADH-quinone oxidoreductase subunit C
MTPEEISGKLSAAGFQVILNDTPPDPSIEVPREAITDVARLLKEDPELNFDLLMCLSGLDWPEHLEVVYHLRSQQHKHQIVLKVRCPKDDAVIPTVSSIWRTAEWHEREAYDLVGMRFQSHQDHRRILLPEDWEGHPLRKDYEPPKFWHKIPLTNAVPGSTDEGN